MAVRNRPRKQDSKGASNANKKSTLGTAVIALFAASTLQARTLTLKSAGSSSSPVSFTSASSWNEDYAPQPGDKVVICQADAYIGSANEEFDIGSAGLTIELQKNTTRCYVKFKGDGHLTFTTSPTTTSYTLELRKACTHTGGTTIGGRGQLLTYVSNPLGTGTVTVDFTASTPRFNISNSGATIPNDIVITGTPNARSICADNKATFNGTITGNGGTLRIDDTYDVMTLNGAVSVPAGEVITLRVNSANSASVLVVNGALNGNLAIEGVTSGSNSGRPVKLASAVCSGTSVSINATATLQLTSANNLNPASTVTVAAGGKWLGAPSVSLDGGDTWRQIPAGNGLPLSREPRRGAYGIAIDHLTDDIYVTVGGPCRPGEGGVYRSADRGKTWERFSEGLPDGIDLFKNGEFSDGPGGGIVFSPDGSCILSTRKTRQLWFLDRAEGIWRVAETDRTDGIAAADPFQPGRFLLCGGTMKESTDGGRTFRDITALPRGFWSVAFDAHAAGLVVLGRSDGLWISRDGGRTAEKLPGGLDYPSGSNRRAFIDRSRIFAFSSGSGVWTRTLPQD